MKLCEGRLQRSRGGFGVGRAAHRPHHRHALSARPQDPLQVALVDASNAHDGDLDAGDDFSERLKTDGSIVRFRGGGKNRAEADVVRPLGLGGERLLKAMGRGTDHALGPDDRTRRLNGQIFLSHVDAVRADAAGDVRPIVDDQRNPRCARQQHKTPRLLEQLTARRRFVAELDRVRPSADYGRGHLSKITVADGRSIDDDVEPPT